MNVYAKVLGKGFQRNAPANSAIIAKCESELGINLPQAYKDFLMLSNGGEGGIGSRGYIQLLRIEAVSENWKRLGFADHAPNYVPLGSDGGGEAFALRLRGNSASFGYMPFIGMEDGAFVEIANDFWEALQKIGAGTEFA